MNRFLILRTFLLLAGLVVAGCNATGGAEAGNPSRTVVGSLPSSNGAALAVASPGCGADQVIATDSRDQSFSAALASDCSFQLTLPVPEAYRLDFLAASQTVASMMFDNSSKRLLAPVMNLSPGDGTIFLDQISIKDEIATPGREPAAQNDQNGNGIPDISDPDADSDGILNEDERDCDLDGIIDDFDDDDSCAHNSTAANVVLEVSPRSGEGFAVHGARVKIDDEITLRFSCPIDTATLLTANLQVAPLDDPGNILLCTLGTSGSGKQVRCDHPNFLGNTVYQAHLQGMRCEDGSEVPGVTWKWKTR